MVKKSKLFIPLTLLPIMAWCIFYYAINADVETQPSEDLCSGFSECAEDEYCAPFSEAAFNDEAKERLIQNTSYKILKKNEYIFINGKKFKYNKTPILKGFPRFVTTIELQGVLYGVCSKRDDKFQSSSKFIKENCGDISHTWPDLIRDGNLKAAGNIVGSSYSGCSQE